jgi:prevent-host-death family protein
MKSMEVNIHQAKTHLSKLLRCTMAGEEVVIARAGRPIARLVPVQPKKSPFPLGIDEGAFEVPEDFDDPLPPELLAAFYAENLSIGQQAKRGSKRRRR